MSKCDLTGEFPVWGLLPRKETGVVNLLSKNPNYDGRGVVIAIFDSGVDPAAPGLQVTTTGDVKIIERIDGSGVGDVDTSTVVEPNDGKIKGLTGRTLKVPENWVNPSNKYHIGCKSAYMLYPQRLREKMSKDYKEKVWDPLNRTCLAEAQRKLQKLESKNGNSSYSKSASSPNENGTADCKKVTESTSYQEKQIKEDAETRVSILNNMDKKFNDLGPVYDCVVFHDGNVWRACIDTSENGDLCDGVFLGEYTTTHEFSSLTPADQYTISINVHNEGNILEIVGMCSSHGTHVAAISAANFPDDPDRNGVAPGAQIVSITIGDNRIGTMETGTGIVRAMARVMKSSPCKIDLINMSYGEQYRWSNSGRLGELAHDVVSKHGVMWIGSAGNDGPALTTVGVPPNFFSDFIIGVGAYVSPDMMTAQYSMLEKLPGSPYTWSSRGPTADGGRGVSVCAPGGAITSVPCFTLRKNQLMNGTSMAAPHTAGCVALLLSGLKQAEIPYSPFSVRRALEYNAKLLDIDPFAQGHGLVQVDKAMDFLLGNSQSVLDKIRFSIECGKEQEKGIYLRNWKADRIADFAIHVQPSIINESRADPMDKLSFSLDLSLVCDVPWVKSPSCISMSYTVRSFKVSIDPAGLERGQVYTTSIKAFISTEPQRGQIFEVPITLVVPHINFTNNYLFKNDPCKIMRIARHFLLAPLDSTYASISIRATQSPKMQRITLHAIQLKPHSSVNTFSIDKTVSFGPNESSTFVMAVQGGLTLEVCLARWWSFPIEGQIECSVEFHSLMPNSNKICLTSGDMVHRVDVRSGLRTEEILPQATLKQFAQVFVPSDSSIEVSNGERDHIPDEGQIYQLVLTYNFNVCKSQVEVTPKFSLLVDTLYESAFESQLWMLFDHNKQLMASGDAYCHKYNVKLDKGEYVIKLNIRHRRMDLLEKLSEIPITILTKLTEVKLDVYTSYNNAITGGRKAQTLFLAEGKIQPYYIVTPNLADKTIKPLNVSVGNYFIGAMSFSKDEAAKKVDDSTLRVFLTDVPSKKRPSSSTSSTSDDKKELKSYSDYQEAVRDLQTSWLPKLDKESSEKIFEKVNTSHPQHLPALISKLQSMDSSPLNENKDKIIELAKQIISAVDVPALLAFYGTKTDTRSDANKIRTQMDRQRGSLMEAWARLGCLYCSMMMAEPSTPSDGEATENGLCNPELLDECQLIADQILKFVEPTESKVASFFIVYYGLRGHHGLSLKFVIKQADDKYTKDVDMKLMTAYKALNWVHAEKLAKRFYPSRFPHAYHPF